MKKFGWPLKRIKYWFLFLLTHVGGPALSQVQLDSGHYFVEFIDKKNNPYSLNDPTQYLSDRAIFRRIRQGIDIDSSDLPVVPSYLNQVSSTGATIKHVSKWMNSVLVLADSASLASISKLPCVAHMDRIAKKSPYGGRFIMEELYPIEEQHLKTQNDQGYGSAWEQTVLHNAHELHLEGFSGQDIWIGVFDSGFDNVDSMSAFKPLRERGAIVYNFDMVQPGNSVYDEHHHGTFVLSTMAAEVGQDYKGMALFSKYLLFRTENVFSETKLEEINWLKAAEVADSLGVDIINTSLSYKTFDGSLVPDYTPADMDGRTSFIARASVLAHRKGILCVSSAGNDGNKSWNTIGTPADTDSILTVGSTDSTGRKSSFSSFGPTADNRTKPDVMAMGEKTAVIGPSDIIQRSNGTSFSGPVMAGLAASVWSKYRDLSNYELRKLIMSSADNYAFPNDSIGYGIPDYDLIRSLQWERPPGDLMKLFPNPLLGSGSFSNSIGVKWDHNLVRKEVEVQIFTSNGRLVSSLKRKIVKRSEILDLDMLGSQGGMFYFRVISELGSSVEKLIILN